MLPPERPWYLRSPEELGREYGPAVRNGLDDLVDAARRFGDTERSAVDEQIAEHQTRDYAPFLGVLVGAYRRVIALIEGVIGLPDAIAAIPEALEQVAASLRRIFPLVLEDPAVALQVFEILQDAGVELIAGGIADSVAAAVQAGDDGRLVDMSAHITEATIKIIELLTVVRAVIRVVRRAPEVMARIGRTLDDVERRTRELRESAARIRRRARRRAAVAAERSRRQAQADAGQALDELAYGPSRGGLGMAGGGDVERTAQDLARLARRRRGRYLQLEREQQRSAFARAQQYGRDAMSRLRSSAQMAEHYVRALITEGLIPELRGARVFPGRIGRGTSGKDFWCFMRRRGSDGPGGPISVEVKHRGTSTHVDAREFHRGDGSRYTRQASPEGDVEDWLRFLGDSPTQVRAMIRDGRLAAEWADAAWVRQNGAAWFSQPRSRYIAVVSRQGQAGLSAAAQSELRLRAADVLRIPHPPRFPGTTRSR